MKFAQLSLIALLGVLATVATAREASDSVPPSANPYEQPAKSTANKEAAPTSPGGGDLMGIFAAFQSLKNAQIKADWAGGLPVVEAVSADLGAGHISLTGKVDFSNSSGNQEIKGQLTNIDLPALSELLGFAYDADVKGTIDAQFDINWSGLKSDEFRQTLGGVGTIDLKNGDIRNWRALDKLAQKSGVQELRTLENVAGFADLTADKGTVRVTEAQLVSKEAEAKLNGGIRLRDDRMKFSLDLALDSAVVATSKRDEVRLLASALGGNDSLVRMPGPFIFEGDAHDPDVKFEFRDKRLQEAIPMAASYLDAKIADEERNGNGKDSKKDKKVKLLKDLRKSLKN